MARSKTSKAWMQEHVNDPYVRKAQAEGMRSRAAYKLQQLAERDKLLKPGMTVVDLGAAPGGWSQVAGRIAGETGRVVAVDLLDMTPVAGVTFIRGDFGEDAVLAVAAGLTLCFRTWPPISVVSRAWIRRAAWGWPSWRWILPSTI
jgi:23S rRNA (uridine2552-2'-O)-methyltransferase